ncbi:MAG: hypothetical protein RL275_1863, partial [Chloroflexota bacterium]
MERLKPVSLAETLLLIFICLIASYLYSCNDRKIAASVSGTLTAQPTATLKPTGTPRPTKIPTLTPTNLAIFSRSDLLGISFDYMISNLERMGFQFEIYDDIPGNRDADGEYIRNKRFDVNIYEEDYSLVSFVYSYGYGSFLGEEDSSPDFDSIAKLIFTDQEYYGIVEPWFLNTMINDY